MPFSDKPSPDQSLSGSRLKTIQEAIDLLKQGDVVALPTETVYGLAGNGYCQEAVARIYTLKARPKINPLILHYKSAEACQQDVFWNPMADRLAKAFWPGPLTLILPRHPRCKIAPLACASLDSVALRMSVNPIMAEVLNGCPFPLAAPSANPSGYLSPTRAEHVLSGLDVPVVDGGPCFFGLESTIVDVRHTMPILLRLGAISPEDIWGALALNNESWKQHISPDIWGDVSPESPKTNALGRPEVVPVCPGLAFSHYRPRKPLRLNARDPMSSTEGLIAFGEPTPGYYQTVQLSEKECLHEASRTLFHALYSLDRGGCSAIAVMPIPLKALGYSIYERLLRGAGHRFLEKA